MKDIIYLLFRLVTTIAKLIRPGGSRTVIAENLLPKQQLIIHSRSRQRAPNLSIQDRIVLGSLSLFLDPRRLARSAIIIKPSTLLRFHNALKKHKYRLLYSPRGGKKPGPKGPSKEVINAIVEMKQRNPRLGCPRIAQQINVALGLDLDKDTVRRILAAHYKPDPANRGPSWLTTLGHAKDSLWSIDLFRCESILLKSHWVMVVMDQTFFWTATNLENKLMNYERYYNEYRYHSARAGVTPVESGGNTIGDINQYRWEKHCRGLFQLSVAA